MASDPCTAATRRTAKQRLEVLLCRAPSLYAQALRRRRASMDKRVFLRLLRPGDVAFDVGANLGYYTALFSHLVGATGQVHAFEPVPPTFQRLSASAAVLGRAGNVHLHPLAVADRPGPVTMHLPGEDHGQASLVRHGEGSWGSPKVTSYRCEATTLDAFTHERGISRLSLLKCDVEGAELPVLRGAAETLARLRPVLHLEVSAAWTRDFGYTSADLVAFLEGLGYSLWYLLREPARRLDAPRTELAAEVREGSANLLALVPAAQGERLRRLVRWGGP